MSFTILSYNIHAGQNAKDQYNLGKIISAVKKSKAEIVGLNEVDRNWSERSKWDDQSRVLPEKLEAHSVFAASLNEPPVEKGKLWRQFGNLLLSEYPILEARVEKMHVADASKVSLEEGRNVEPRTIICAKMNLWTAQIWILCTHLTPYDWGRQDRLEQIGELEKIIGLCEGPLVLMGDLNASPDSQELLKLRKILNDPSEGRGFVTKPDEKRQIDYILVRDLKVEEIKVLDSNASDHLPLWAKIRVQP